MTIVQIFSNEKCMPLEEVPSTEHSANFYRAVSEMEAKAGRAVSFVSTKLAIIPLEGDLRYVVMG
jgi:hypothetical protein